MKNWRFSISANVFLVPNSHKKSWMISKLCDCIWNFRACNRPLSSFLAFVLTTKVAMSRNDLLLHIRNQGRRKAKNSGGESPAFLLGIGLTDLSKYCGGTGEGSSTPWFR